MTKDELRRRRLALGLTAEQLGQALNYSETSILRMEWGTQPIVHGRMLDLALTCLERERGDSATLAAQVLARIVTEDDVVEWLRQWNGETALDGEYAGDVLIEAWLTDRGATNGQIAEALTGKGRA